MKKIFKYELVEGSIFNILIPGDFNIVHVGKDPNDTPCFWAIVDELSTHVLKRFKLVGTGEEFDANTMYYMGSYRDSPFMWHLFEVTS